MSLCGSVVLTSWTKYWKNDGCVVGTVCSYPHRDRCNSLCPRCNIMLSLSVKAHFADLANIIEKKKKSKLKREHQDEDAINKCPINKGQISREACGD